MSRTYRRKVTCGAMDLYRFMYDWDATNTGNIFPPPPLDPKSTEGKKRFARWRSDGGTYKFKEPGPAWYRNVFVERPQRREVKRAMQRVVQGEEFEVLLCPKKPRPYWT